MEENEQFIQNLQKNDHQIQHNQYNINELFDVEFLDDDDNILQANMLNENLISNIQDVDYNKYFSQRKVDLQSSEDQTQFCDNIILFYLLPTKSLKNGKQDIILTQLKNTKLREVCKKYNIINNISIDDVKHLRKPQQLNSIETPEKKQINQILQLIPKIREQYQKTIYNTKFENYQTEISYYVLKIECQNIPFDELINNFEMAQEELNQEGFYLFQLDITQDFLGNFDKQKTIRYLCEKYNFGLQNNNDKKQYTILQNEDSVGNNCLSYITDEYEFTTRHKIYNKFICQLTSTSVQKKYFSNHLIDIFNSNTLNLKQSLQEAKDLGITRFEITVYNSILLKANDYKQLIIDQFNLFKKSKIFYFTSLQKQYKALEEKIKQNLLIVDNLTNKIYCGLWANYLTQQTIGQTVKFTQNNKQERIQECIQNFSFVNLPCYILQVSKINKQNISIDLQCFIRNKGEMLIQQNYKKKSDQTKILFNQVNGLAQDLFQNQDNVFKWTIDPNINNDREQQQQQIQDLLVYISQKEKEIQIYNDRVYYIMSQFKTDHVFINQIKQNLQENQSKSFYIIAFKFINNIFYCLDTHTNNVICISNTDKYNYTVLINKISIFKQFTLSKSQRRKLTYKEKAEDYFSFYAANFNDLSGYKASFILEIKKNNKSKQYLYQNKTKQLEYVKKEQLIDIKEYDQKQEQLESLQKKVNDVENLDYIQLNSTKAIKFEQLSNNTNYVIKAIQQFNYTRGKVQKIRYYILINDQIYISNSFFEKQIQAKYKDQEVSINQFNVVLQTITEKTTESKNKELNCLIRFQ
ncbi:hypothetical protein ABPG72_018638 [Tetrahymena utriculariae]